jgi:hypothetical protein
MNENNDCVSMAQKDSLVDLSMAGGFGALRLITGEEAVGYGLVY